MNELTQELKLQYQNYNKEQLNQIFVDACIGGNLNVVRYVLTSKELTCNADIHGGDDLGFILACQTSRLDVVAYLLTSPELTDHANIHAQEYDGFIWACGNGCLKLVEYLLTSPELKKHADIHVCDNEGFQTACLYGRLNVVEFLLTFSGKQYIDFEKTPYNLAYFMKCNEHTIVKAMITSLCKNDMMSYLENISKVEKYCQEHDLNFVEWQEEILRDDVAVNSKEEALFL